MTSLSPLGRPLSFRQLPDVEDVPDQYEQSEDRGTLPSPERASSLTESTAVPASSRSNDHNPTPAAAPPSYPSPDHATSTETQHTPSSHSISSTARERSQEATRQQKDEELGEPSDRQFESAGMAATIAPFAGGAAQRMVATGGQGVPGSWKEVQVDDKYHIWSSAVRDAMAAATKKGVFLFGFITLWLWVCLSIFWGSNYKLETFFPRLTVQLVSFDTDPDSYLTAPMVNEANYQASLPVGVTHLGWQVHQASEYPNGPSDVMNAVLRQDCWMAVVINANATSAWMSALQTGDASYDPTGAMTVYYQSARFYQVTLLYFEQILSQTIANPLATARGKAYMDFLTSVQGNTGALTLAAQVPQAVGVGFGYNIHDLRPIPNTSWAGVAPMEAGLIYFVIFAFYIALFGGQARMKSGLSSKLTFRTMLALRMGWPLLAYFFMSLWFTCIERAFQAPTQAWLGSGGFVALWALNFATIVAAGWAMETALAVVGISWLPMFLILWIILNITSSFYPIELMPTFYRFLYWTPFLHNVEGYKIIAYGTNLQSRLGLHFGILFALIGVELICFPLSLFFERWSLDRSAMRDAAKKDSEE